jgi:hypothetical protein
MRFPPFPRALARSVRSRSALRSAIAFIALAAAPAGAADAVHPTVIELFQSQGCSSWPPANAALIEFAAHNDALALNFAVDYWDRLGWKDNGDTPSLTELCEAGQRRSAIRKTRLGFKIISRARLLFRLYSAPLQMALYGSIPLSLPLIRTTSLAPLP